MIEYIIPYDDLMEERKDREVYLGTIIALFCISFIFGILGIFVEYTSLGNKSLSHEETNFENIDIPIIQEGSTHEQLKKI